MSTQLLPRLLARVDPPDVGSDEARRLLLRELTRPEYVERNLMARLWEWFQRTIDDLFALAAGVPLASWIAGLAVGLLLLLGLVLVLSRFRRTRRADDAPVAQVMDTGLTADELRRRARTARESGDHTAAVADAYRALAVRQVERRRIVDQPGATAHEVGDLLADLFVAHRDQIRTAASLFDLALYSDRPTGPEDADLVLALDEELDRPRQVTR